MGTRGGEEGGGGDDWRERDDWKGGRGAKIFWVGDDWGGGDDCGEGGGGTIRGIGSRGVENYRPGSELRKHEIFPVRARMRLPVSPPRTKSKPRVRAGFDK